jgi:flavoprotein
VFDATNSAGDSSGTGTVSLNSNVAAGDSITIDYYGVTNSSSASSASVSFTVGSSAYTYSTNSVSLTSVPTTPVNVVPSDATPGAAANYTISGIAAPSGGIAATTSSSSPGGTIVLTFPTGTVLPVLLPIIPLRI